MQDAFQLVGKVLDGKYRLDGVLGEGGYGVVYAGRQLALDQPVAVKCLKPSEGGADVASFLREARVLFGLSHPGIVRMYDVGEVATPQGAVPYVVLERIDGRTLDAEIEARAAERRPFTAPELLALATGLLDALAFAHARGVVHRDIKPANVMVVGGAAGVAVKILDFGLARGGNPGQKTTGNVGLTPRYAAPEQWNASYGAVGPATDLFALGLVLEEAATLAPALAGDSLAEVVASSTNPARRSSVPARRPDLPPAFAATVDRATRVGPTERFASAEAMSAALRTAPVAAPPPPASYGPSPAYGPPPGHTPPPGHAPGATYGPPGPPYGPPRASYAPEVPSAHMASASLAARGGAEPAPVPEPPTGRPSRLGGVLLALFGVGGLVAMGLVAAGLGLAYYLSTDHGSSGGARAPLASTAAPEAPPSALAPPYSPASAAYPAREPPGPAPSGLSPPVRPGPGPQPSTRPSPSLAPPTPPSPQGPRGFTVSVIGRDPILTPPASFDAVVKTNGPGLERCFQSAGGQGYYTAVVHRTFRRDGVLNASMVVTRRGADQPDLIAERVKDCLYQEVPTWRWPAVAWANAGDAGTARISFRVGY